MSTGVLNVNATHQPNATYSWPKMAEKHGTERPAETYEVSGDERPGLDTVLDLGATVRGQTPYRCPRRVGERLIRSTGELKPQMCGANGCTPCARHKAGRTAEAIRLSQPTHMLTFTLVGSAFSAINAVWTKVRQNLRRLFRFEAAYVVECNRGGAPGHDHHLHALAHGTVPHPELLSEKAQAAGWGMGVDVTPVRDVDGFARYLLKQVREETLEHHLEMNGRQLIHTTRGFWRLGGRRVSGGMDALLRTAR